MIRKQVYPIVVDRRAITALETYWRACGEPRQGVVFLKTSRSGKDTTASNLGYVVTGYLDVAGLSGVDRRRLNAPFAVALLDRGWDAKVVADAFGYGQVRSLLDHVRPVREQQAQRQSSEIPTTRPPVDGDGCPMAGPVRAIDAASVPDGDRDAIVMSTIPSASLSPVGLRSRIEQRCAVLARRETVDYSPECRRRSLARDCSRQTRKARSEHRR